MISILVKAQCAEKHFKQWARTGRFSSLSLSASFTLSLSLSLFFSSLWFFTPDPFRGKISASAARLSRMAAGEQEHMAPMSVPLPARRTDRCTGRMWRRFVIYLEGGYIPHSGWRSLKLESMAEKKKGERCWQIQGSPTTWITIVIYLLRPGCFLSIKSRHILHLRGGKPAVIAPHTNQHNLCNYALKVTLEAESDVSGPDSGGGGTDSSGDFPASSCVEMPLLRTEESLTGLRRLQA